MAELPSPVSCAPIFDNLYGIYKSQLLKIAVELGIFDALKGSRTATADQLAEELQLKADRLVRFLRSLVTLELLELHDNGFRNTSAAEVYLVKSSGRSLVDMLPTYFQLYTTCFDELVEVLKGKGDDKAHGHDSHDYSYGHDHKQSLEGHGLEHDSSRGKDQRDHGHGDSHDHGHKHGHDHGHGHGHGHDHGHGQSHDHSHGDNHGQSHGHAHQDSSLIKHAPQLYCRADMDCLKIVDFTGCNTVIDLGGNFGWHARQVKRFKPSISHVIVADLEHVVVEGSQLSENKDAGIEFVKVNYLTDNLPAADAFILSQVLHASNDATAVELLTKIYNALNKNGQLIILEAVLQPDRVKPFNAVVIDIGMLSFLRGRGRSSDDYKALIEQAGFTDFSFHPTEGSSNYDVITARKV